MAGKIVKVLGKYRAAEDPELGNINVKCLSTLSKEEILVELEKRNMDGVEICSLGGIEPEPEYLCKILHFCMEVDSEECGKAGPSAETEKGEQAPQPKRRKVEEVTVRSTLI